MNSGGITTQCTGAAKPAVLKWTITRRSPVIADFIPRSRAMNRVLVILPHAFELFEAAAFIDVLGWANQYGDAPIRTITAGIAAEISCTFGVLQVRPDVLLSNVDAADFDAVAIPGGFEAHGFFEEAYAEVVLRTLRDFDGDNKPVASICVGALPLGKSGILKGKKATTYHLMGGKRRKQLVE